MVPPRQRSKPTATRPPKVTPDAAVLVERHARGWRLTRGGEELAWVRHLDQIQDAAGVSLVETGGVGAHLSPTALGQQHHEDDLAQEVIAARVEARRIANDLDDARRRWRLAARALRGAGMATTRMAQLMGISRMAVDNLLSRAEKDPVELVLPLTGLALAGEVEDAKAQVDEVTRRQTEFSSRWQRLATALQDVPLSNRDVGHLMGVSTGRVQQLSPGVRAKVDA